MPSSDHRVPEPTAAIRQAIVRIADQRAAAAADAGRVLVNHEQAKLALREQRMYLARARAAIDVAIGTARDAANAARADALAADRTAGAPLAGDAAAPFERSCAGFESQRSVVDAAIDQLDHLDYASAEQIDRARDLLRETLRSLDDALREQIRLLVRIERIERARLIARARADQPHRTGPS